MKKLLALLLASAMIVGFTACTNAPASSESASSESSESSASEESSEESASEEASEETSSEVPAEMTMEEYLTAVQPEIDAQMAELEAQGLSIELQARDNSLVYSYTYTVEIEDLEAAKTTLDTNLEATAGTFELIYDSLILAVPSATSIIVEYYAMDGSLITSAEFN